MIDVLERVLRLIELEGSTWMGRANIVGVLLVLVLHRVESLFKWFARRASVRLGTWFQWRDSAPPQMKGSMLKDMAIVVFFLFVCLLGVQLLAGLDSRSSRRTPAVEQVAPALNPD